MTILIHPDYYRIFECRKGQWFIKKPKVFYRNLYVDFNDLELLYGITNNAILDGLETANQGKDGYYIADLKHRKYYYGGTDSDSVDSVFEELEVGHPDAKS
jgi:hypothetical protein